LPRAFPFHHNPAMFQEFPLRLRGLHLVRS
jgi:hypothetical protein